MFFSLRFLHFLYAVTLHFNKQLEIFSQNASSGEQVILFVASFCTGISHLYFGEYRG